LRVRWAADAAPAHLNAFSARSAWAWHGKTVRILVVDDDRHLALAVKRGLEAEGFAVDGADGSWLATENPYGRTKK
jgi:PleD family two-component response regulator